MGLGVGVGVGHQHVRVVACMKPNMPERSK